MADKNQDDVAGKEELQMLMECLKKRTTDPGWGEIAKVLFAGRSKRREAIERAARPVARNLMKDLQDLHSSAAHVLETVARIDDERQAREAAKVKPTSAWQRIFEGLVDVVFSETSPVEEFAKAARADMEAAWVPVLEQTQAAIEKLKEGFEAVSLTHSTEKPGFQARLRMYQAAGLSESEIAKIERTSIGAVHQARRRMPKEEGSSEDKGEGEQS